MSEKESKIVKIIPLRDFVTGAGSFKTGEVATVNRADGRAFVRKRAAAWEGDPAAEAAIASAKSPGKKPAK